MNSPQRFNRTNFVTNRVAANILQAMQKALSDGLQHYVENKRGQRWLRVCIKPVDGSDNRFTYEFLAGNGQDVGHLILQALFVWDSTYEATFARLIGELYSLTKHPYTLRRQAVAKVKREAAERLRLERLKAMGVTHSFRTDSGTTLLGRWRRSWLGRKVFEVLSDHSGLAVERPYKLTSEAQAYGSVQGAFA